MRVSKPIVARSKKSVYRKRRYVKKYTKSTKVPYKIKKYVLRTIHKNVENKTVQYQRSFGFGGNPTTYSTLSFTQLTPGSISYNMVQGTGQSDRVGNSVRIMKAVLRYILLPVSYDLILNPTPKPQEVQILFGYIKGNTRTAPSATAVSYLYQNGNSSAGPTGLLGDVMRPINKDFWVIKKRIRHKVGYASNDGTGANAGSQFHANNDFKYNVVKSIDITKMLPQKVVWNEADVNPTSRSLFMMISAVNADNTNQLSDTAPCGMTFWLDVTYEDA